MKIDINVKNSSVNFINQTIDIKQKGLYFVTGPNGSGKTTILKHIVFTKHFDNGNVSHFSYVEQDPEKYDISVNDYLMRFNKKADNALLEKLMKEFELEHIKRSNSIMKVSGGELVKLNIIAALIKENEFVFLDEPTNNLDNQSVDALKKILIEYLADKVVIVVTHDPRLMDLEHNSIKVEDGKIEVTYMQKDGEENFEGISNNTIKYPWLALLRHHVLRPLNLLNLVLLIIYAGLFFFFNHFLYGIYYNCDTLANKDGSVLIYSVDGEYAELNQKFAKCENITVQEDRYLTLVQYDSIPDIYAKGEIKKIYIENEKYVSEFFEKLSIGDITKEIPVASIPQTVLGYSDQFNVYFDENYLVEGRYPEDGKKELITSQNILATYFPDTKLGDEIVWNEETYTLVGIHLLDFIMISYTEQTGGYFYQYDAETYEAFVNSMVEYKKEIEAPVTSIYCPGTVIIQTTEKNERNLLLSLFLEFPANNYRSYSYDKDFADYYNKNFLYRMVLGNIIAGGIFGLLFFFSNKRKNALHYSEAASIDNYYLSNPLTRRFYSLLEMGMNAAVLCIFAIIVSINAEFSKEILTTVIGYGVLCTVASIPYVLKKKNYD